MKYDVYKDSKVYHILDPEPAYDWWTSFGWSIFLCGYPLGDAKIYKSRPKNKRICKVCAKSIRSNNNVGN